MPKPDQLLSRRKFLGKAGASLTALGAGVALVQAPRVAQAAGRPKKYGMVIDTPPGHPAQGSLCVRRRSHHGPGLQPALGGEVTMDQSAQYIYWIQHGVPLGYLIGWYLWLNDHAQRNSLQ